MPEFYIMIARKMFPRFFFWGGGKGGGTPLPPSLTPMTSTFHYVMFSQCWRYPVPSDQVTTERPRVLIFKKIAVPFHTQYALYNWYIAYIRAPNTRIGVRVYMHTGQTQ